MSIKTSKKVLTVTEAIESRRSIRRFLKRSIPNEKIEEILELTRLSPSAWNLQPWRFHIINDPDLKDKLQEVATGNKQITSAPAVIVVTTDMEDVLKNLHETTHPSITNEHKEKELMYLTTQFENMTKEERGQWGLAQANIALGFLLIAIQGLGYASSPMLGFDQAKVQEILQLPHYVEFAAMVAFGYPDEKGDDHHRLELNKIAKFY